MADDLLKLREGGAAFSAICKVLGIITSPAPPRPLPPPPSQMSLWWTGGRADGSCVAAADCVVCGVCWVRDNGSSRHSERNVAPFFPKQPVRLLPSFSPVLRSVASEGCSSRADRPSFLHGEIHFYCFQYL